MKNIKILERYVVFYRGQIGNPFLLSAIVWYNLRKLTRFVSHAIKPILLTKADDAREFLQIVWRMGIAV